MMEPRSRGPTKARHAQKSQCRHLACTSLFRCMSGRIAAYIDTCEIAPSCGISMHAPAFVTNNQCGLWASEHPNWSIGQSAGTRRTCPNRHIVQSRTGKRIAQRLPYYSILHTHETYIIVHWHTHHEPTSPSSTTLTPHDLHPSRTHLAFTSDPAHTHHTPSHTSHPLTPLPHTPYQPIYHHATHTLHQEHGGDV